MIYVEKLNTPIGTLEISASDKGVCSVYFVAQAKSTNPNSITEATKMQLSEYFDSQRKHFELPLDTAGTEFQKSVWQALLNIEFGKTCAYQDIAQTLGNPKAVRAVGSANGKNPVSIIVPCHRVIGANGDLSGYAGGVDRKAWLLKHEGALLF